MQYVIRPYLLIYIRVLIYVCIRVWLKICLYIGVLVSPSVCVYMYVCIYVLVRPSASVRVELHRTNANNIKNSNLNSISIQYILTFVSYSDLKHFICNFLIPRWYFSPLSSGYLFPLFLHTLLTYLHKTYIH